MVQSDLSDNDQPVRYSLKKSEILRGEKLFQQIIQEGETVRTGNIFCHYVYRRAEDSLSRPAVRVGFSVPRRWIRKAVDRNRVKRLMREAYRTDKHMITEELTKCNCTLDILFVFQGKIKISPRYLKLEDIKPDITKSLKIVSDGILGREMQ